MIGASAECPLAPMKSAPKGEHTLIGQAKSGPASFPSYKADLGSRSRQAPGPGALYVTLLLYHTILRSPQFRPSRPR